MGAVTVEVIGSVFRGGGREGDFRWMITRPEYGDDYYGAFLLDPDGNSIEAVHHGSLRSGGIIDHLWIRVADVNASQAFYDTIADGFGAVNPAFNSQAHFVDMGDEVFQVKTMADAINAINRIKGEGEGAPGAPDQPANPAHSSD